MTRDELIAIVLSTRTREEVIYARQALDDWAAAHPDDISIWEGGEMVEMLADAYGIPKTHTPEYQEYKRQHPELFPPAEDTKGE